MDLAVARLGTILGIWAHPDDEAYLMGAVMALARAGGQHVACVTATLGDAGETADADRWPRDQLSTIRQRELERSLAVLGVTDHENLGLADGQLEGVDGAGAVARLAAIVERVRPDTVITFGPDGMTGHPDHRTISDWAGSAVEQAAPGTRVLWATKTDGWGDAFGEINGEVFPPGLPPRTPAVDAWTLEPDDEVLERKVRALEAHASQTQGLITLLGRERFATWVCQEAFVPSGRT